MQYIDGSRTHSKPCSAKGRGKKEDHGNGPRAVRFRGGYLPSRFVVQAKASETTSEEHGNALNDGSPVKGPAATNAIKREDADECCQLEVVSADSEHHRNEQRLTV